MSDLNGSLAECNVKMNKAIDVAKEDFSTIRTGRAHPSMFAKLMVDYYGLAHHFLNLPPFKFQRHVWH